MKIEGANAKVTEYYIVKCDGISYGRYKTDEQAIKFAMEKKEKGKDIEIIKVIEIKTVSGILSGYDERRKEDANSD